MLITPPIEELLPKVENRYILTMLTAKRARQLVDGAQPFSAQHEDNGVTIAAWELAHNQLAVVKGQHEVSIPLRPEVEAQRLEAETLARAKREEALMEENRRLEGLPASRESLESQIAETELQQQESSRDFTEQLIRLIGKNAEDVELDELDQEFSSLAGDE